MGWRLTASLSNGGVLVQNHARSLQQVPVGNVFAIWFLPMLSASEREAFDVRCHEE